MNNSAAETKRTAILEKYKLVNGHQPGDIYLCRNNGSSAPVAKFSRTFVTIEEAEEIAEACNSHAALTESNRGLRKALEGVTKWAETIKVVHAHPFLNNRAIDEALAALENSK